MINPFTYFEKHYGLEDTDGLILKGVGGLYSVLLKDNKKVKATPRGAIKQNKDYLYPGDIVRLSETGDELIPFVIEEVHPRRTFIKRPALANLDTLIITCSAKNPVTEFWFIDKMIVICAKGNINPAICITKSDLDKSQATLIKEEYKELDFPIFVLGFNDDDENEFLRLKNFVKGKIISFAGQSGVGKSTLLNRIVGKEFMKTGIISVKNKRGKHTTRHSELFLLNDTIIADTPGFSNIEFKDLDISGEDVIKGYPEIKEYEDHCKFSSCRHLGELGCAATVLEESTLKFRLERYREFRKEADNIVKY